MTFDVAVLGGGPAGAVTAGLLARRGPDVVLLEKTRYDTPRIGDSVPPAFLPLMNQLGLEDAIPPDCYFRTPGIVSAWGGPDPVEHDFLRMPYGYGLRLDRTRFDRALAVWAEAGGCRVMTGIAARRVSRRGDAWRIEPDRCEPVAAGFVVDASGRNGFPLEVPVQFTATGQLVAVVSFAAAAPVTDRRILIETTPSGWWYSALLPNASLAAMFFTDRDLLDRGKSSLAPYLQDAPLTAERLMGCELAPAVIHYAPSRLRARIAGRRWLAAGDSACAYDPVSGQGICKALQHASWAADVVAGVLSGDESAVAAYETRVIDDFHKYEAIRLEYYRAENRWPDDPFWCRRQRLA